MFKTYLLQQTLQKARKFDTVHNQQTHYKIMVPL